MRYGKQVLRACGAQDDSLARVAREKKDESRVDSGRLR